MATQAGRGYSCAIFDFGGVISHPPRPGFFTEMGELLDVDPARFVEAYRHHRTEYDRGSIEGLQYWKAVVHMCGGNDRKGTVDELIERDMAGWTAINQAVLETIRSIGDSGCRLAVLSNMPWDMGRAIRREHPWLERLFDVVTFSCELGMVKPEPGTYTHTAARLGAAVSECVFVDDTLENVIAARKVGMAALHFGPDADLGRLLASAARA